MAAPWFYFLGVDYAPGGVEGAGGAMGDSTNDPDDFACTVLRARESTKSVQLVYLFRQTGIEEAHASAIIHRLHKAYRFYRIMLDPGGGGLGVRSEMRKVEQNTGTERFNVVPICTNDDMTLAGVSDQCLSFFRRGDPWIDYLKLDWQSESALVNKAHTELKTTLANGHMQTPAPWSQWDRSGIKDDVKLMREYLNHMQGMSDVDRVRAEIDLCLAELLHVDREKTPDGQFKLMKGNFFSFKSRYKKDAAYALLYAHFAVWVWRQIDILARQRGDDTESQVIVSAQEM
jgi:hypothetical protein